MPERIQTVAIFGVGLIGGSFALALRKAGFSGTILGVSSPETLQRALDLRIIDRAASTEEAANIADLLYLAQPIRRILTLLPELNGCVRPDALVTDAGSTKSTIMARATDVLTSCHFLGGHPLAGKEQRGTQAADADLFQGRKYVLTPRYEADIDRPIVREFLTWIVKIGAIPVVLGAAGHDRTVAYTSHLPQLASTALATVLDGRNADLTVSGPALLDMTRLALSPFDVWGDILATNGAAIRAALECYIQKLKAFSEVLDADGMAAEFERASAVAKQLRSLSTQSDI